MPRPWRFHERQSGLVVLTGNMPNGRVTLVTRVNGCYASNPCCLVTRGTMVTTQSGQRKINHQYQSTRKIHGEIGDGMTPLSTFGLPSRIALWGLLCIGPEPWPWRWICLGMSRRSQGKGKQWWKNNPGWRMRWLGCPQGKDWQW